MSKTHSSWLLGAVCVALVLLGFRMYDLWSMQDHSVLDDRAKYLLSRSCTDAQGWPEVSDYAVACHEFRQELHIHVRAQE